MQFSGFRQARAIYRNLAFVLPHPLSRNRIHSGIILYENLAEGPDWKQSHIKFIFRGWVFWSRSSMKAENPFRRFSALLFQVLSLSFGTICDTPLNYEEVVEKRRRNDRETIMTRMMRRKNEDINQKMVATVGQFFTWEYTALSSSHRLLLPADLFLSTEASNDLLLLNKKVKCKCILKEEDGEEEDIVLSVYLCCQF